MSSFRGVEKIGAAVLFVFAVGYGVSCVRHGAWDYSKPASPAIAQREGRAFVKQGTDFTAFYSAGELALAHKNIYDWTTATTPRRPFIYPPMFALFPMMPMALFSHNVALGIFYALNALSLVLGLWLLRKALWPARSAFENGAAFWLLPGFGLVMSVAANWRAIHSNTFEGNANLMVFFLIALAVYWDCESHRSKENKGVVAGILSGMAVALASVFKLTPGLFGVFFLWSWRRCAMLGGALGLAVFLLFAPALWFGWDMNMRYLRAFSKNAAGKAMPGGVQTASGPDDIEIGWGTPKVAFTGTVPETRKDKHFGTDGEVEDFDEKYPPGDGVSFRAVATNLLTPTLAIKNKKLKERRVNFLSLETAQARTVANVCSVILLLLTVALTFSARFKTDSRSIVLCWSLVTVAMVLVSPLTRVAHLVALILPVTALVALVQQRAVSGKAKVLAWSALMTYSAGIALLSGVQRTAWVFEAANAAGFTTLAILLVYAALAAALVEKQKE